MKQQTVVFLQTVWKQVAWRDEILSTFGQWVQDGASRREVKMKLEAMLTEHVEMYYSTIDVRAINWDQLTEFLCLCFYRKRVRKPLPSISLEDIWIQNAEINGRGLLSLHPQPDRAIVETVPVPIVPLEQKLLAEGGKRMVYRDEPDLGPLLRRGRVFNEPVEYLPGEPRECHANVCQRWHQKRDLLAIVTGYALSEDGLWRQHSWLMKPLLSTEQNSIIETTMKRIKYFGFILTDVEAENFYENNSDEAE